MLWVSVWAALFALLASADQGVVGNRCLFHKGFVQLSGLFRWLGLQARHCNGAGGGSGAQEAKQ